MDQNSVDEETRRLLGEARAKAVQKRKDEERRRHLAGLHAQRVAERQAALIAAHGALLWRAGRFWNSSRFIRSILQAFQNGCDLTPYQINGLAKATTWAEHNLTDEGGPR